MYIEHVKKRNTDEERERKSEEEKEGEQKTDNWGGSRKKNVATRVT